MPPFAQSSPKRRPGDDGSRARTSFPEDRRFRREALVLILLLGAWQAALVFMASGRGLRSFAVGEPTATLETLAPELLRSEDGALYLAAGGAAPAIARLAGVELEPDVDYVVTVRADSGLAFDLLVVEPDSRTSEWNFRVPPRADTEQFTRRLAAPDLPSPSRLEIRNKSTADLLIYALRIDALRRAHGWTRNVIIPLGVLLPVLFAIRQRRILTGHFGVAEAERHSADQGCFTDGLVALLFFFGCFNLYLAAPVQQLLDAKFSTAVSHRLMTAGSLALPLDFSHVQGESLPYQLQAVGDKLYHIYPDAVAVLNVPIVALFHAFDAPPVGRNGLFLRHRELRMLRVAAAVQAAVLCALLYLLARIYLRPAQSLVLASVFAFGTQMFSTVSRAYWSHSWALLLMAGGLFALLVPRWRDRAWSYVLSASLLSWSFFCRPPMSLSILGLTVLVAVFRRRHFFHFAASGLGWAALFAVYSWRTFGQLLPPYFLTLYLETGTLGAESLTRNYPGAVLGTLISPGRGLFVYVPFVALLLILVAGYWRRLPQKALATAALVVLFGHWQLICSNQAWWVGGFGARLFSDVLIWLYVLAVLVLLVWNQERASVRPARSLIGVAAVLLVAASVWINARGATASATTRWSHRSLWEWRDPQFLAGLTRWQKPTAELLADLERARNVAERGRLLREIVRRESLVWRQIDDEEMLATAVTWDHWTYGVSPGFLVVTNTTQHGLAPRLALATWADQDTYPITVSFDDGQSLQRYTLSTRGVHELEFPQLPADATRVYVVRSDKAWSPGGGDQRILGVQLRAAETTGDRLER